MFVLRAILFTSIFILSACGSGKTEPEDTSGNTDTTPTSGSNTPPNSTSGNDFCASNSSTSLTLLGKFNFEYAAENNNCFGLQQDSAKLSKKLTSIELENTTAPDLVLSNTARLTQVKLSFGSWFYYGFDITNTSNVAYCSISISGLRRMEDTAGNTLLEFGGTLISEPCIAAGETKSYYDSIFSTIRDFDINTIDKMVININASATNIMDSTPLPFLNSNNFEWSATAFGAGAVRSYDLSATIRVINNRNDVLPIDDGPYHMVFLDDNNFPIYTGFADPVGDNLTVVNNKVSIPASGGTLDIAYTFEGVNLSFPEIYGSASKVRIQLQ